MVNGRVVSHDVAISLRHFKCRFLCQVQLYSVYARRSLHCGPAVMFTNTTFLYSLGVNMSCLQLFLLMYLE